MEDNVHITQKETVERLVSLETEMRVRKESDEKALILARQLLSKDLELARTQMDHRLELHNQWQSRWDKRELLLATKKDVAKDFKSMREGPIANIFRLLYIGTGIILAAEVVFKLWK